jgi:non-ribosomal peptide synthetase component F
MVLLAAVQVLLASYTGQEDICVGSAVAGRTRVELEPVIGLFANTVALRGDLSGDPTFGELLGRTRKAAIAALARQNVPFSRVVDALNLPRIANRTQLFQVIFSMRPNSERTDGDTVPGLQIDDFPHAHAKTLHDLVIDVWRLDEQVFSVGFRYDDTLFDADTVAAMAQRYERLLAGAVARPDARLSELLPDAHWGGAGLSQEA